jgi:arabinose-5-phosphate isomerase
VPRHAYLSAALLEMSRKGLGMTAIVDADEKPIGIFTDGDLRRAFENGVDVASTVIEQIMHPTPRTILPNRLAAEAVELMESNKINGLLVVDEHGTLVGALNMHDLLKAKVV